MVVVRNPYRMMMMMMMVVRMMMRKMQQQGAEFLLELRVSGGSVAKGRGGTSVRKIEEPVEKCKSQG